MDKIQENGSNGAEPALGAVVEYYADLSLPRDNPGAWELRTVRDVARGVLYFREGGAAAIYNAHANFWRWPGGGR